MNNLGPLAKMLQESALIMGALAVLVLGAAGFVIFNMLTGGAGSGITGASAGVDEVLGAIAKGFTIAFFIGAGLASLLALGVAAFMLFGGGSFPAIGALGAGAAKTFAAAAPALAL